MHELSELLVGGFVPLTTTDYPGKLAAVIFCQGCPWSCAYCHNPHLIPSKKVSEHSWEEIFGFLQKRIGLLDGVVFSGGEPTMQSALEAAIKEVFDLGFSIGLHTAGQYPRRLEKILPYLSWVGLDIKAPFGRSSLITQRPSRNADQPIQESLALLLNAEVDFECRTTWDTSLLTKQEIIEIANQLKERGVAKYFVQQCRAVNQLSSVRPERISDDITLAVGDYFKEFGLRA